MQSHHRPCIAFLNERLMVGISHAFSPALASLKISFFHSIAFSFSQLSILGFIGSHTALALLEHGYNITIIDNLDNSFQLAVDRVKELAGDKAANMTFIKGDLRNYEALDKIFGETK